MTQPSADYSAGIELTDLFTCGQDGYHTHRIPALIVTGRGTVCAFVEGRRDSRSDTGDIDLLVRRSTDGGEAWGPTQTVWAEPGNTCGNPCPVVDRVTGTIWLLMTWNLGGDKESAIEDGSSVDTRRVFVTRSTDDGLTWADPTEITDAVKPPHWRWYATGPCNGIQLTRGPHKGRLVIPCDHSNHEDPDTHHFRSHAMFSDDHGQTWRLGDPTDSMTNESTAVELPDGSVMLNMRSYAGRNCRAVSVSRDGGQTWSAAKDDPVLIEARCQGSILRYAWPEDPEGSVILFANCASTERRNMTVRVSRDEGRTWPASKCIYPGSSAYACLTRLPDGRIGLLFERDDYARVSFTAFPLP